MSEVKPLIETTNNKPKEYNWATMEKEGHLFPHRCPEWSGAGIMQLRINIISMDTMPSVVIVCTCGVIKSVLIPN